MKKVTYKNPFKNVEDALSKVPETLKENDNVFIMTDGNKTLKVRWEGTLTEGVAVPLTSRDEALIKEEIDHMKRLWGYKSEKTLGTLKGDAVVNENKKFMDLMADIKKKRLIENTNHEAYASFQNGDAVGPDFENTLGRPMDESELLDEGILDNVKRIALALGISLATFNAMAQESPQKAVNAVKDKVSSLTPQQASYLKDKGVDIYKELENLDILKYKEQQPFQGQEVPNLNLGDYKNVNVASLTSKNLTDNGGYKYVVDIKDRRYIDTNIYRNIAEKNKGLKNTTIEFTINGSPMPNKTIKL